MLLEVSSYLDFIDGSQGKFELLPRYASDHLVSSPALVQITGLSPTLCRRIIYSLHAKTRVPAFVAQASSVEQ
jgi:hypothetical protein